jgi:nucleoside-diphosphate-sugar epimerase
VRVLVTGHDGYIGTKLVPMLQAAGHEVVGLDTFLYADCTYGSPPARVESLRLDVRDVEPAHVEGFDAVIHLAAISNDPVGDLNPDCTLDINHTGTFTLARAAKRAGISRFLFSSSCSLYGAGGDGLLDETASFNPVTPYGHSKLLSEQTLSRLADDDFSPTYLRNATAYGVSPRLRGDLVVNNLVGFAVSTGEVLLTSDGTPWRPLVHIEDIARAFLAALEADRETVHDQAFNIGRTSENYRISEVAAFIEHAVPGSRIAFAASAGPDLRNYRVSCEKAERTLPSFEPIWTVADGIQELLEAYGRFGLTTSVLDGPTLSRIRHVRGLIADGRLDEMLRWQQPLDGDHAQQTHDTEPVPL